MNSFIKLFTIFLLIACCLLLNAQSTQASTMSDNQYILDLKTGTRDIPPIPQHSGNVLSATDTNPRVLSGENYTGYQGLPYVFSVNNFIFSLSSDVIDFGPLSPTNPITRTQLVNIDTGSSYMYKITAQEDHELLLKNGKTIIIPNTTCDDGMCSEAFHSNWTNTLTYGFGYHCDNIKGRGCVFSNQDAFEQFVSAEQNTSPSSIMEGFGANKIDTSQLLYKVNIPTTQPKGLYSNIITFMAVPGY